MSEPIQDSRFQSLVWEAFDATRGEMQMDFAPAVEYLRAQGEHLTIDELMILKLWFNTPDITRSVMHFFGHLLASRSVEEVLVCSQGTSLTAAWLADQDPDLDVNMVAEHPSAEDILAPLKLSNLSLHVKGPEQFSKQRSERFDAVIIAGPIGMRKEHRSYETSTAALELFDEPASLAILDAAKSLSTGGILAAVVPPRFVFERGRKSVRVNLERFGLHISALLSLRPGTVIGTSVGSIVAIIDKTQRNTVFVAEVPEESVAQKDLVERLRRRKQGPVASQGRLVDPGMYHGLDMLEAAERYVKIAKNSRLSAIPFSSAILEIRTPKRTPEFERCEEVDSAVYLPLMATTDATTHQDRLPPKLKSYIQLVTNPEVVLPVYLASWLNTPLGRAFRESTMTGTTIPRINNSILQERKLYLPGLEVQQQAVEAQRVIGQLRSELTELETKLWEQPKQAAKIVEVLSTVNHEDRLTDWLESLPFPLASILRAYHAVDRAPKERYERLLHFFEAFAEYCATIHLSALRASSKHWQTWRKRILDALPRQEEALKLATFGTWRAIVEMGSADLRKMLGKDDARLEALAMYVSASSGPLEMIANRGIVGILQRVNGIRNLSAHGGAVTVLEARQRHTRLEDALAELRTFLGTGFNQYQLIEAKGCDILEGPIYRSRIRRVMGSNPQLEHDIVDLTTPAITGRLYLHNPGHDKALPLVPLIQVDQKAQPASYFYNRFDGKRARMVTYSFATQSEIFSGEQGLLDFLEDFELGGITQSDGA